MQLHVLKDNIFDASPFIKTDVEEATQEINLIDMDNNEDKLVDIE